MRGVGIELRDVRGGEEMSIAASREAPSVGCEVDVGDLLACLSTDGDVGW